jgi:hypothetical protein
VELLRIKYQPTKYDFGLKHVKHDLPVDVTRTLEKLYQVTSCADIMKKLKAANTLFSSLAKK